MCLNAGLFVEFYDGTADPLYSRTGEVDYQYQAEQHVIDGLEDPNIVRAKAFFGPRPENPRQEHNCVLFREWEYVVIDGKRDLKIVR